MKEPLIENGVQPPENSEIRKIADDILGALKYSFAATAANPDAQIRQNSVEEIFSQAIQSMPVNSREGYLSTANALLSASRPAQMVMFGRAAQREPLVHIGAAGGFERFSEGLTPLNINKKLLGVRIPTLNVPISQITTTANGLLIPSTSLPEGFENIHTDFESAREAAEKSDIYNSEKLSEIWGSVHTEETDNQNEEADFEEADFEEFAVTDKLGLWIRKVKCVDETGSGWWGELGDDEIALAGISVDEDGDTKKIPEKRIGNSFDDGESKTYGDRWRYEVFSLREGDKWPKTYSVTFLLAEKDWGGLSTALHKVWKSVQASVKAAIEKAIEKWLERYLGSKIARAIARAVSWIISKFVSWLKRCFADDIFPPYTTRCTALSMSTRWRYSNGRWGNPRSPIQTAHFYGYSGHYYIQYYWKFH